MKQNVYRQWFVQENADCKTYERFKKENQFDTQTDAKQGE